MDAHTNPLIRMSAVELTHAFARGTTTPSAVTHATLDLVDQLNDQLVAFCHLDRPSALRRAQESDRRWRDGSPLGPLDGVPISIKDVLVSKGWPTRRGSRTTDPNPDRGEDSPPVARLRAQGAVLIGKTTTPEFGWKGITDSPLTGVSRNPWDPSKTPGGSSGGSGIAVAAGMGPISIGTDGGGSLRIPAAFCGVVGFKPSQGLIPMLPPTSFGDLVHVGPLTRTVADAAVVMDVLCAANTHHPPAVTTYRKATGSGVKGVRIAVSPALGYVTVDPEIADLIEAVSDHLSRAGAHVRQADPGFDDPTEMLHTLWFVGAAKTIDALPPHVLEQMDPGMVEIGELGRRYSGVEYMTALQGRAGLREQMAMFHRSHDLLITPTVPITAFDAGQETPTGWQQKRWTSWSPFTFPFNLTQQPAVSVPCGIHSNGLPVGIQVVGSIGSDREVLAAAAVLEEMKPQTPGMPVHPPAAQGGRT